MVFKGGTAIKKIYFELFRFSEDLDFTCSENVSEGFANFIINHLVGHCNNQR
jgi:predicted nucleotidyltransferase component of viral defense system